MGKKEWVTAEIKGHKVVVFSKTYCPYCKKAKDALKGIGLTDYTLYELDERDDGAAVQDALQEITGGRTVPRVFVGGDFIGGGDDTARLANNGELAKKLKAVGAL
ncbi:uncharacterized protein [Oscarella lobularis]|uniref:uncharacterized protein n=1 Tax=Oscarella lobularis TaxID=121494 RepID=UPI00331422EE